MKKFDFLTKTLINSFSYTTITKDRETYTDVNINGRRYTKWGTLQAVTIVGNLYKDCYGNRVLVCGVSRQHPNDAKCNKQASYEAAQYIALTNPDIVINNVPEYLNDVNFGKMMSWYVAAMKLEFIRTNKEIKNMGDTPQKYNR